MYVYICIYARVYVFPFVLHTYVYTYIYVYVCARMYALDPDEYSVEKLIKLEGIVYEIYFDSSLLIEKYVKIYIYIYIYNLIWTRYI